MTERNNLKLKDPEEFLARFQLHTIKEIWMYLHFVRYGFLLKRVNANLNGALNHELWLMVKRNPHFFVLTHRPNMTLWSFTNEFPTSYPKKYFKNKHVVDVGSYIGDSVVYFIRECKSKTVIAYEPHPLFYRFLEANICINSLHDCIISVNKAISSKEGKRSLKGEERASRLNEDGEYVVETESFEKLADFMPDIVKLDCEGMEHEIIENASKNSLVKIKEYVIEIHGHILRFISKMKSLDYEYKILDSTDSGNIATVYFKRN